MPIRKKLTLKRVKPPLSLEEKNWLYDLPLTGRFAFLLFHKGQKALKALWESNKADVLAFWLDEHPCSRPGPWWAYDSPRQIVDDFPPDVWNFPAPRQRIGGIGTPSFEVLNIIPSFVFGIPDSWVQQWQVDYYNGRAVDVHGERIATDHKEGDFKGMAINPDDPPAFESEAMYLQRHGLLTAAEKQYLKRHPALLQPEKVTLVRGKEL